MADILSSFIAIIILLSLGAFIIISVLTRILFFISEQISLTNIYHRYKTEENEGEYFKEKLLKMCACNFNLTVPVILSFMFIVKNTMPSSNFSSDLGFIVSLILTLGTLVSLRILSNPTNQGFKPKLITYFKNSADKSEQLKIYKERMSSFFFSFISATLLFILVAFFYGVTVGYTQIEEYMSIVLNPTTIHFPWYDFGLLFLCYTVLLVGFTAWGELILKRYVPLLQLE